MTREWVEIIDSISRELSKYKPKARTGKAQTDDKATTPDSSYSDVFAERHMYTKFTADQILVECLAKA